MAEMVDDQSAQWRVLLARSSLDVHAFHGLRLLLNSSGCLPLRGLARHLEHFGVSIAAAADCCPSTQALLFCKNHAISLLCAVLLPPLVWRAGKSTAAVRYDALTALHTLLSKRRVTAEVLVPLLATNSQLIPLIIQCMDEDWYVDTRRVGCLTLTELFRVAGGALDDAARRSIYPELNKRMDDSSNDVRIATAAAIAAFAEDAMPVDYCDTNSGYFVAALLIHLDDGNAHVQAAVQAALFSLAAKKGRVVRAEIGKVYDDFRSKFLLDQVLEKCG